MKTRIVFLAYLALAAAFASTLAGAQSTFTQCAIEGGTCTLATQKSMRYGEPFTPRWSAPRTVVGPIPCTNAYWGDPAPGTGKRCEVMDVSAAPGAPLPPAPVESGILPPLATGEAYLVRWTQPTMNVDGTPIGPILRTLVQASSSPTFATFYEWIASVPGVTFVSIVNGPSGAVYWRARVETAGGLSDYTASAITERQYVAEIMPSCWPKPVGSGSWVKAEQNGDGFALYWQCVEAAGPRHAGFVGTWASMKPDWMAQLSVAIKGGKPALDALWNANITGPSQASKYATVRPLFVALQAANPLPAGEVWTVKALTGSTSRPAYRVDGAIRSTVQVGKVGIGMPCDCAAHKSSTSTSTYCAVTGQSNLSTAAVDVLPASAAICSRVP